MKIQNIIIEEELPLLEGIDSMKDHRRIKAFHNHGASCSKCGIKADRFVKHHTNHWDIFDVNGCLMSCSKTDLKPYCHKCINSINSDSSKENTRNETIEFLVENYVADFNVVPTKNDYVCRIGFARKYFGDGKSKITGGFNNGKLYDKVMNVLKNPATGRNAVMLESSFKESYYHTDSVCVLKLKNL